MWIYVPSTSALAQESAVPSGEPSADEPSAMWRRMLIASGCCRSECETGSLMMDPSGRTCLISMDALGEVSLTSCLAASPASPGAWPERDEARPTSVIFGPPSGECFARWDPPSRSLKTSQASLFGDCQEYSESLPKTGMMRSGRCWRLKTLVPRTGGRGSGLLPTPRAIYGEHPGMTDRSHLTGAVRHWPTPDARDANAEGLEAGKRRLKRYSTMGLQTAVRLWPTPGTRDHHAQGAGMNTKARSASLATVTEKFPNPMSGSYTEASHRQMSGGFREAMAPHLPTSTANRRDGLESHGKNVVSGQLSADWVELLMGWPCGWTSLEPLPGLTGGKTESPASPAECPTGPTACESSATVGFRRWLSSLWHALRNFYSDEGSAEGDE